ncbi:uncharacterized protein LOC131323758 [Rhododendron vialii]|uniref:uncharacterized protein LOC131323758 n=1 Tax=Rhododendron vialii TaxID=182163 RepID=UPI00265F7364|nr:uncharacterized protein LOC131323758 [Rhododendron vialii]
MKVDAFQKQIIRELTVDVSKSQLYRAKNKAKEMIEGDHFVMGLLAGCGPMIGLDGAFLKGLYGGQILSAIGVDGNNNMFPIAIAVVEAETKESWTWFLNILLEDIGSVEERGWTFISDRQKGLVETFKELMPNAKHRFCLRHLYANYRKKFRGLDKGAHKWLKDIPAEQWCRSHFSSRSKYDYLVNNLSESFNNYILEARDKQIISMLEWIRRKVMNMFQIKRMGMEKYNQAICPRIMGKLDVMKKDSKDSFAHFCGEYKFEVDCHDTTYTVDLKETTCRCRQWDLIGIPCKHACAAIGLNKQKVEEHVHPCYSRDTYLGVYQHMIQPIPGKHDWVKSNNEEVLPPFMRRPSGKPKKVRRKAAEEAEDTRAGLSRAGRYMPCSKCLQKGHNLRSCKNPIHPNSKLLKKRNPSQS